MSNLTLTESKDSLKEVVFDIRLLPKCSFAAFTQLISGSLESSIIFISNMLVSFSHLAILFSEFGIFGLHLIKLLLSSFTLFHISNEIEFHVSVFPLKYTDLLNSFVS